MAIKPSWQEATPGDPRQLEKYAAFLLAVLNLAVS